MIDHQDLGKNFHYLNNNFVKFTLTKNCLPSRNICQKVSHSFSRWNILSNQLYLVISLFVLLSRNFYQKKRERVMYIHTCKLGINHQILLQDLWPPQCQLLKLPKNVMETSYPSFQKFSRGCAPARSNLGHSITALMLLINGN